MSQNLNMFIAFLAGVLSFLSPCVLPLIPSYLSLIGGASFEELSEKRVSRSKVFLKTLLFVAGFSLVFILLGVLFSGTGGFLSGIARIVGIIAGALVILLGLNFIFNFWKFLNIEKKVHLSRAPRGTVGALLLGMAFGAGWTPCVGPILASILFLAGSGARILQGTTLLAVYSLGLGLPFVLAGLFFSQFMKHKERLKAHFRALKIASGVFLVFIGLLILLGRLQRMNIFLFKLASGLQSWQQASPAQVRIFFALLFFLPALLLGASYIQPQKGRPENDRKRGFVESLRPARLAFALLLLSLFAFTLAGFIRPVGLFTFWFTFQGI